MQLVQTVAPCSQLKEPGAHVVQMASACAVQADERNLPGVHAEHGRQTVSEVPLQLVEAKKPGLGHVEHGRGLEIPPVQRKPAGHDRQSLVFVDG
jgi:hypothetical protein